MIAANGKALRSAGKFIFFRLELDPNIDLKVQTDSVAGLSWVEREPKLKYEPLPGSTLRKPR